jgi:bacteriocin-like protein
MENFDELPIEELTDRELDLVSGGWMTQLIHMDYHKMDNFNDPTAVRYA